jgi:predicted ATPase
MKIGVKNFRIFKDYTEFDIRPITILTGPNSSGKSSFTKLLMLLREGIETLQFKKGAHNLKDFENELSWDSKYDKLEVSFIFNDFKIKNRQEMLITYSKNKAVSILGKSNGVQLEHAEKSEISKTTCINELMGIDIPKDTKIENLSEHIFHTHKIEIEKIIENLYNYKCEETILLDLPDLVDKIFNLKELKEWNFYYPLENLQGLKALVDKLHFKYWDGIFIQNSILYNNIIHFRFEEEVSKLTKDFLLFNVSVDFIPLSPVKIREMQKEVFSKISYSAHDIEVEDLGFNSFKYLIDFSEEHIINSFNRELELRYKEQSINCKTTRLFDLMLKYKIYSFDMEYYSEEIIAPTNSFYQRTVKSIVDDKNINLFQNSIKFISSKRGSHSRVYFNDSEYEIDKLLVDYVEANENRQNQTFVNDCMKIIGLNATLEIDRVENTITTLLLDFGDKKIPLSDVGFGYSQVLPIILKIALHTIDSIWFNSKSAIHRKILIIEEPEANLHPNLQSKLADVFVLAQKTFPNLQLILETHSEYLIRKLQYLTAKEEIGTKDSIIYYFNSDENVSKTEPKVKEIEITNSGNLTDNFGPGFYDEATTLKFELMKLNKNQQN